MEKAILHKAGLTENESNVYLLLISKESSLASEVAKKANISRPHIYDTLNNLVEKGLVSYIIKDRRKYFKAAPPKELLSYIDSQKHDLIEKEKELKKIIPKLNKLQKQNLSKTYAEIYEGKSGVKTIYKDILNDKKNFIAFGASQNFEKKLPVFSKIFIKQREKIGMRAKLLVTEGVTPVKTRMNNYRWVSKTYSSPSTTIVYNKKVAIIIWNEPLIGVLIKSKETAKSYENYFQLLWKIGKTK